MPLDPSAEIALSPLEQARFGVRAARAFAREEEDVARFDAFCAAERVDVLIVRCSTAALNVVRRYERSGALLMDCLVYYTCDLPTASRRTNAYAFAIKPVRSADADDVAIVAARAFADYRGHYHADPLFDPRAATDGYADWARRSCEDESVADAVFAAYADGAIAGFITLKRRGAEEVEILLNGVDPALAGRGVYASLLARALDWAVDSGAARCVVSTQLDNVRVQRSWVRHGFTLTESYYTFHKWYRSPGNRDRL